ncbi:hypothetical protein [Cognatilysobacter terrigena]|uniref:hypothetical protein n=1 Tax=Cognatilysobacter terrigena TaxID=2488749 RepID=UPI00105F8254|nr:hypothetical protein [Lysobacter terrigena]
MADPPILPDLAYVAPGNDLPLHAARAAVTASIRDAIAAGRRALLVDFHAWSGNENPSLALRIDSVFEWAAAAEAMPGFVMALVMPPQLVDPGRIGFIIGRRLSFDFDVFGAVDDAMAWIEAELANAPRRNDD